MLGNALKLIHTGRAPTRAILTSALGVTRATTGTLVSDLQALGLIQVDDSGPRDAGEGAGRHGRPSHRLAIDPAGPVALAVQVHPDGFQVAVVGLGAHIVAARSRADAIPSDPARALAEIAEVAAGLLASAGRRCVGAGLAVPSAVASAEGAMVSPLYLGWPSGTPVRDLFAGQLRVAGITGTGGRALSCSAGNDINLAALAEHRHGAGRGASHLLMLSTGRRGVGGALVLGGEVYTGSAGLGMEAGHVSVDVNGLPCPCGSRGCLNVETDVARFTSLARPAAPAGKQAPGDQAPGKEAPGDPTLEEALELLRDGAGDPAVEAAVATLTERLGVGLAGLVNVVNPDRIVLGGLHRYLLEADPAALRAAVAAGSPWGRGAGVPLVAAALEQAALLGAAEIAWRPVLDYPGLVIG